ncbi:MAG: hypothetical protein DRN24_06120, partial [Thermoplasmata archaeon]
MDKKINCIYNAIRRSGNKTIIINCRNCKNGNSTIFDSTCRTNIFSILQTENNVTRVILNHAFVKVFRGDELQVLKNLNNFIENLKMYINSQLPQEKLKNCISCNQERHKKLQKIFETAQKDPFSAFLKLKKLYETKNNNTLKECSTCEEKYKKMIWEIFTKSELSKYINEDIPNSDLFYRNYIRPYVRPGFIDSYIQLEPPPDAVFLESYEVKRKGCRPVNITLYVLKTRPEKLYFIIPSEYDLPRGELFLLERVRGYLSRHRPKDVSFMDAESAREYFQRLGKKIIARFAEEENLNLSVPRIEYLADVFSRYTAGFGILEDLLLDTRIQDVYVNAPVVNNPLHIV